MRRLVLLCLVACASSTEATPVYPRHTTMVAGEWSGPDTTVTLEQFARCQWCYETDVPVVSGLTAGSIRGDTLTLGNWRLVVRGDTMSGQGPRLVRQH